MLVMICNVYLQECRPKEQSVELMLLSRMESSPGFRKFAAMQKCSLLTADAKKDKLEFDLPEALVNVDEMELRVSRI